MTVKTAISLDDKLFEQVECLMQELEMSRSRVIATALQEYIKRREKQKILDKLNEVYSDGPTEEEEREKRAMKGYHQKIMADEAW
ncbi:MAG: ribbon-helix-helix protein, CopG family [Caldilineaceae bacterium]|nr:ribbon-helix-helix protein, CopG family [Caldilineaceae bacterium]